MIPVRIPRLHRSGRRVGRAPRAGLASLLLACAVATAFLGGICPARADQNDPKNDTSSAKTDKNEKSKPAAPVLTEDNEVKIGRENAEENDKHIQLVTDAALVSRVNRIGQELAAVANTVPIPA